MSDPKTELKYTAEDWDRIRKQFLTSMMIDTKLSSLAENLDSPPWPLEGSDETPDKYMDYEFGELIELPELKDHPERINLLLNILEETMSFDDPFGDMVDIVESEENKEEGLLEVLDKLHINRKFPISLSALTAETLEFLQQEEIETLDDFVVFSQNMAQNIVLGGDFREFLNALSNNEEKGISKYIPFRYGEKGLHLPEAIAQSFSNFREEEIFALLAKYGRQISDEEAEKAEEVSSNRIQQIEKKLQSRLQKIFNWFDKQRDHLKSISNDERQLERYFAVLHDPDLNFLCQQTILAYDLGGPKPGPSTKGSSPSGKTADKSSEGIFGKLKSLFSK
ncbi:MAG: hypothetical protein JJT75_01185 [Opitutales bacterium]|nr:hypothetical protein [Opitutales bacterium]MCH8540613.1 hypothetical protein [Opitutales bacterium]